MANNEAFSNVFSGKKAKGPQALPGVPLKAETTAPEIAMDASESQSEAKRMADQRTRNAVEMDANEAAEKAPKRSPLEKGADIVKSGLKKKPEVYSGTE